MPATMRSALVAHSRRFAARPCRGCDPGGRARCGARARSCRSRAGRRTACSACASRRAIDARPSKIGSTPTVGAQPAGARQSRPSPRRPPRASAPDRLPRAAFVRDARGRLDRAPLDDLLVELAAQIVERAGHRRQRREHQRAQRVGDRGRDPRRRTTSRSAARARDRAVHRRASPRRSRAGSAPSRRRSRSRADRGGRDGCRPRCGAARAPRSTGSAARSRGPRRSARPAARAA